MDQKNKKTNRTFIPQSVGDTIKKINRKYTSKFGKIEFVIQSKWPEIAGSYFREFSEPKNITRYPDYENEFGETIYKNHLNVSVAAAAAVEFQHYKDKIVERINSYFGYKAIFDLRIQQNYITKVDDQSRSKMKISNLSHKEINEITNEVKVLSNKDLKKSLIDLGKIITKDSK